MGGKPCRPLGHVSSDDDSEEEDDEEDVSYDVDSLFPSVPVKETIEFILQTLPETRYVKNSNKNPLIVQPSTNRSGMMMMMAAAEAKAPHPAGIPQIISEKDWERFAKPILQGFKPSELLLALNPVTVDAEERSISKLILDPAFNLK